MTDNGRAVFGRLIDDIITGVERRQRVTVKAHDYKKFCHEYLFDAIRGLTFGQAFCKKFCIYDAVLIHTIRDEEEAKRYIQDARYVETQVG